ncbi:nicotinamide-nucleotide amidase [Leucobacter exalbidus]|uniref:Nicotinamide-nucleotide amidase n=1 Tax=Leucobacter exalbidus TaxID=662960 RepID=A0A940PWJ2_9MICO|nr:CinA family protein [Leucobacter exalbidus]MBP1327545.1 nicotinamide-nucleotide amidase [Leucobacter exalbidus]
MTPARAVIAQAGALNIRIAVAESLTGGLLASALVSVPGASRAFSGGIVAYDTELKRSLLGVDAELLERVGPVDGEVARQMARGVRRACAVGGEPAALGISTTGVAGPDPDQHSGQQPGTVWIGVSSPAGERAVQVACAGDRAEIRAQAVVAAVRELEVELGAITGHQVGTAS